VDCTLSCLALLPSQEGEDVTLKTDQIIGVFVVICFSFGLVIGCVGLGAALIFLSVAQAFGVGILSAGCGALFGLVFGGKRIMRALVETLKEMEVKT
jgi:hypothetical protein